jgi:hypothetical protein
MHPEFKTDLGIGSNTVLTDYSGPSTFRACADFDELQTVRKFNLESPAISATGSKSMS